MLNRGWLRHMQIERRRAETTIHDSQVCRASCWLIPLVGFLFVWVLRSVVHRSFVTLSAFRRVYCFSSLSLSWQSMRGFTIIMYHMGLQVKQIIFKRMIRYLGNKTSLSCHFLAPLASFSTRFLVWIKASYQTQRALTLAEVHILMQTHRDKVEKSFLVCGGSACSRLDTVSVLLFLLWLRRAFVRWTVSVTGVMLWCVIRQNNPIWGAGKCRIARELHQTEILLKI